MATASSTTKENVLKPCEIESCERISAAICCHCNKTVCRRHFVEHADQLVQELHPLADHINELGEKISSFDVKEYKQKLLDKLTEWRDETIKNTNALYEMKKQKLDLLFQMNDEIFASRTADHLEIADKLKNETTTFIKEDDVTSGQLNILKRKLHELKDNINNTHTDLIRCDVKPLLINYASVLIYSTTNSDMYGGTLLCTDYQMKLNDFYGNAIQKWELIYKATIDGFHSEDFHRCSDNRGPTMTIIQSKNGNYLFGGYTEISWTCDNKYKKDPNAFIFTLRNPHDIQPTKFTLKSKTGNAIGHAKTTGSYFGGVVKDKEHLVDIWIASNADINQGSSSSFPSSYIDTTGKGETLFTGEKKFMVEEIEVYKRLVE
ncbi:unnamed protein product [Adineta steineri]|uniref:TLDc domain-containing protein n=1 Tax=Adineta steineri TaxID=433720 RepID=A0A813RRP6_9BILA|nr:unnamed protein product [Adineta steineri]CAF0810202.1 unnamed protein product [Adineta steineri]CAF3822033.1 unnamed protein product [Adineta steineri]CAF4055309.1 unnamed protein product [Adineta steineri]